MNSILIIKSVLVGSTKETEYDLSCDHSEDINEVECGRFLFLIEEGLKILPRKGDYFRHHSLDILETEEIQEQLSTCLPLSIIPMN